MPEEKLKKLIESLKEMDGAVLAFSGGADSTLLLKALALSGMRRALAVTSRSATTPEHDIKDAEAAGRSLGVPHIFIETAEMDNEAFAQNPPDRCFHCKDELFEKLSAIARERGFKTVLDGSTADDMEDHRPGMDAARKHGVRSPLLEAGFTKKDVREASKHLGLPTWDKPSSPCLSSRFPYGTRITRKGLRRVGNAEKALREMGFRELRVRDFGETARIEIPEEDFARLLEPEVKRRVIEALEAAGYKFVSLDLGGLRSGSLNRVLD